MTKGQKRTKTSAFGVSNREAHDSSDFYDSRLFKDLFAEPVDAEELKKVHVPAPGDWADQIYHQDARRMPQLPDNSIGLAITSPPYNASKEYDEDLSLEEYLELIGTVAAEVYRVLRPGGRYAINVANLGRKPYIPLHAFFHQVHIRAGFLPMGEIIWQKAKGASGSTAWGSWLNAKSPRLRDLHEYVLVYAKQAFTRPDEGESSIERDEFLAATVSVWEIPPESAKRIGHPAPFPVALAQRLINLYSYTGDVVLDPFIGSGTTAMAAAQSQRHYVGYEIESEYVDLAQSRIGKLKQMDEQE